MSKKRKLIVGLFIVCALLGNFIIWKYVNNTDPSTKSISLKMDVTTDTLDQYQMFYSYGEPFEEKYSSKASIAAVDEKNTLSFSMAATDAMRMDLGSWPASIRISRLYFEAYGETFDVSFDSILANSYNQFIKKLKVENGELAIASDGNDAYIIFENDNSAVRDCVEKGCRKYDILIKVLLCLCMDAAVLMVLFNMNTVAEISVNYRRDKKLILNLAKNDFKTKYAGSYFGIFWAFVQPVITVLVYWFVFEVGLRSGRMCDYPFILWLMCGLVPWFFFSEALGSGTNALTEYSYLVKKVVFKIDVLPMVKVFSAIFVHLFFVGFTIILHACYGYVPDLYTLQLVYYIGCTFVLVLALSYLTSAVVVFFKDLNQIIGIILQIGIWATPILWDATTVSTKLDTVMRLNPVYYIVTGFRDSLLAKTWIWERPVWTIYFWSLVVILYIIARKVFVKLQVHFADVL